jgi:hypothetical protein
VYAVHGQRDDSRRRRLRQRAYLGNRRYAWLTPKRLRAITILLAIGAVLASATLVSGSG